MPRRFTRGIYLKSRLSSQYCKELIWYGYEESDHIGLKGGKAKTYLLKPRYNESAEHFFVIKQIDKFIRKYTKWVKLYVSVDADIVFTWNGIEYAIEIETGKKLRRSNPRIENKVRNLNKKYSSRWFFVVTNWEHKRIYKKYGPTYVRKEVPPLLKSKLFDVGSEIGNRRLKTPKFC